jgi:hypothetical protein
MQPSPGTSPGRLIDPYNSAGPAVAGGKLVGVAFSGPQRSDNVGYLISMGEVELFLADVREGR